MTQQVVLFIHGLGGDPEGTWGSFPKLVRNDPDLSGSWATECYSFPSSLFRLRFVTHAPSVELLAGGVRTELKIRYPEAKRVVLVCHSLGGLVARRYLLDEFKNGHSSSVTDLLLYGTPNAGSGLAHLARKISWFHPQLKQLCRNSKFLDDLNKEWNSLQAHTRVSVLSVIGGKDDVVSPESAKGFWGNDKVHVVVSSSHRDLVKPEDTNDLRYLILKWILKTNPPRLGVDATTDFKEALPHLDRTLKELPTNPSTMTDEKRHAIEVVWRAVYETQRYLRAVKDMGKEDAREGNSALVEAWSKAALVVTAFDGELAHRLRKKAEYWNDPKNWSESECQHAGIMMEKIAESSRNLLQV